jgi:1-acyl-sn-glycerol-3-phosphate acyltransferase
MFRTIIALFKMIFFLMGKNPLLRKVKRLDREGKTAERDSIVNEVVPAWARFVVGLTGAKVEVTGEENIPKDTAVVFIGNHQGYMDIPVLLGHVAKPKAFIAKVEILKVPMLSGWMTYMQCGFLDRKNMRQSVRVMQEAVETVKKGYSLVIFPEGTRSKGGPVGEFKAGSFKLALKAGVPIVPVTIDGSWRLLEETGKMAVGLVRVTVHPAIQTAGISREDQTALPERVRSIVASALPETATGAPRSEQGQ